jgi:hypothetical protein
MLSGARGDEIGSRLIETAGKQSEPKFEGGATVQKDESPAGELAQSNEARLRKRGRRPGDERRAAIHEEIMKYGGGWRDHLGEIFEELDRKEIPLGNFYGKKVDLGDSTRTSVSKWGDLDLTHGKQRSQIVDVIRKYADNLIAAQPEVMADPIFMAFAGAEAARLAACAGARLAILRKTAISRAWRHSGVSIRRHQGVERRPACFSAYAGNTSCLSCGALRMTRAASLRCASAILSGMRAIH